MALKTTRLDRFISQQCSISRRDVRLMLAQRRICVEGRYATDIGEIIDAFSQVCVDGKVFQANSAYYVMLHKPVGVVCATQDKQHKTVIDLLDYAFKASLHIVGRLDLNSSGLVLLTNDSRWSERLTLPEQKVPKKYRVTLKNPIDSDYIDAFAQGMYFDYEGITTKPAQLRILSDYCAEVVLTEGRYHQIKRMFGRFRNPVLALHRYAIGGLLLDENLTVGQHRELQAEEVSAIFN